MQTRSKTALRRSEENVPSEQRGTSKKPVNKRARGDDRDGASPRPAKRLTRARTARRGAEAADAPAAARRGDPEPSPSPEAPRPTLLDIVAVLPDAILGAIRPTQAQLNAQGASCREPESVQVRNLLAFAACSSETLAVLLTRYPCAVTTRPNSVLLRRMAGMATELGRVPRPVGQVRCCGVGVRPDGAASLHRAVQVSRDRSSDVVAALAEATPGGRDTAAGVVWMAPEAADHVGFPIFARVSLPDLTSLDLTRAGSLDLSACGARLPALNTVLMREDVQNVRLPAELPALSQVSFGRRAPSTLSAPFGGMYADRKPLAEGFLPPSSARNVRRLELTNRRFEAVPAGCAELTHLVIARAAGLRPGAAWLPPCSSGKLTHILASDTNLERIPEGLTQLKYLKVDWCRNLKPDFLPESSAGKIVMLSAAHTPFVKLPPNMHALTELCIIETRAEVRATHWLPATSATQLRILRADACGLERLPEGCAALEELSVSCNPVRQNWLPASSAGKLRILRARGCPQHPLPAAPHLVTHEEGPIGPFPGVFSGEGPIPAGGAGGANPFGLPAGLANFIAMAIFGELFGGPGDDGDGDGADADADGDGDGDGPGGNGPTAVEGPPGTLTIEVPGMPFLVSIGAAPPGLVGMPPPAFMTIGYGSDSESESESSLIEEHQFDVNHPFAHEEEYYSSEEEYY